MTQKIQLKYVLFIFFCNFVGIIVNIKTNP